MDSVRRLITSLSPPIILRAALLLWRRARGIGFYTFEANYPTLEAVPLDTNSYDDKTLAERIVQSRLPNIENISAGHELPIPTVDDNGKLLLPLLVSLELQKAQRLTIVDFGGGLGVGLVHLLNHVVVPLAPREPVGTQLNYLVIETPSMCKAVRPVLDTVLKKRFATSVFAEVMDSIPSPPTRTDHQYSRNDSLY